MTDTASLSDEKAGPEGLAGWLILPVIGTVLAPVHILTELTQFLEILKLGHSVPMNTGVRILIGTELVVHIGLLVAAVYVISVLFRKKRSFPFLFSALYVFTLGFSMIETATVGLVFNMPLPPEEVRVMIFSGIACLIWVSYMVQSSRVHNTFVN